MKIRIKEISGQTIIKYAVQVKRFLFWNTLATYVDENVAISEANKLKISENRVASLLISINSIIPTNEYLKLFKFIIINKHLIYSYIINYIDLNYKHY